MTTPFYLTKEERPIPVGTVEDLESEIQHRALDTLREVHEAAWRYGSPTAVANAVAWANLRGAESVHRCAMRFARQMMEKAS